MYCQWESSTYSQVLRGRVESCTGRGCVSVAMFWRWWVGKFPRLIWQCLATYCPDRLSQQAAEIVSKHSDTCAAPLCIQVWKFPNWPCKISGGKRSLSRSTSGVTTRTGPVVPLPLQAVAPSLERRASTSPATSRWTSTSTRNSRPPPTSRTPTPRTELKCRTGFLLWRDILLIESQWLGVALSLSNDWNKSSTWAEKMPCTLISGSNCENDNPYMYN